MFERLLRRLPALDPPPGRPGVAAPTAFPGTALAELISALGGARLGQGAYRVHDAAQIERWTMLAHDAMPQLEPAAVCFASDWVGRQFALTAEVAANGKPGVVLVDVFTDDVLHTDLDLVAFHDLLGDNPEPVLALDLFDAWRSAGQAVPGSDQCVEYTLPLFLGGDPDLSNMSVVDMEVAWHVASQLLRQLRSLPPGTHVTDIQLEPGDRPSS